MLREDFTLIVDVPDGRDIAKRSGDQSMELTVTGIFRRRRPCEARRHLENGVEIMTSADRLLSRDRNALVDALVSARKRIVFYAQRGPKGTVYEQQNEEALRKIAAALAALGFEGDGDDNGDDDD